MAAAAAVRQLGEAVFGGDEGGNLHHEDIHATCKLIPGPRRKVSERHDVAFSE